MVSISLLLSIFASAQTNRCDNLYAKVTYGLSHTKKAMTATNFEHQMYYAERAYTALEKSKEYQSECGCTKLEDQTLDVMEVLEKAIEPFDWEAGRFYTKKSMAMINELITSIDECTQNDPAPVVVEDSDNVTLEHEAYTQKQEKQSSTESLENEMAKVFQAHAEARLDSAKKAVEKLVLLSKTYNPHSSTKESETNSLVAQQRAYLEEAKKILEEGIQALGEK
ncbi:hypothetical protein CLV81_3563 [Flagellimonas meridianipacifica]|uniref:Uncharacterized protein n=2 Tax=Flagellimonas meridianipacifica TaxID=1080225 RepID=A0A2T0MCD2_9FLAO|nr:hypothetical protein CLV81_3563 [Allomuricauda pacifica]